MEDRIDGDRLEAWQLFLGAHARVVDRLEHELEAQTGLPLTWYDVLVQLQRAPEGRLRMQDLVSALVLSKSGLTRRIDRMQEAGLVQRHTCPSDARGVLAVITPKGLQTLKDAAPAHLAGVKAHFTDQLSDEETVALRCCLGKIVARLSDPSIPGQ